MKKLIVVLFFFMSFSSSFSLWEKCNSGIESLKVIRMATIGDSIFIVADYKGIYFSTDNGATWSARNNGIKYSQYVLSISIIGNKVFAGGGGIFVTTDWGNNWIEIKNGVPHYLMVNAFAYQDSVILAAATMEGLFRSTNNGDSWYQCDTTSFYSDVIICDNNVFHTGDYGTYLSTDMGDTWEVRNRGLPHLEVTAIACHGEYILAGSASQGIYLTSNLGYDWLNINNELTKNYRITSFEFDKKFIIAGVRQFGIIMSTDLGENWISKNDGLIDLDIYSLAVAGEFIFAGTLNGIYRAKLSDLGITDVDDDKYELNDFALSPNPASDYIEINVGNRLACSLQEDLKIYNSLGECVMNLTPALSEGEGARFDVSQLAAGVYFVRIGNQVEKFAIIK